MPDLTIITGGPTGPRPTTRTTPGRMMRPGALASVRCPPRIKRADVPEGPAPGTLPLPLDGSGGNLGPSRTVTDRLRLPAPVIPASVSIPVAVAIPVSAPVAVVLDVLRWAARREPRRRQSPLQALQG